MKEGLGTDVSWYRSPLEVMTTIWSWRERTVVQHVDVAKASKIYTLKWLVLYYVNLPPLKKKYFQSLRDILTLT